MDKVLKKIDDIINSIPPDIRDIIQKTSLAAFVLASLIGIIIGVKKGMRSANPGGMQLATNAKELFYLRQIRAENAKRKALIEDISIDKSRFPSNMLKSIDQSKKLGIRFREKWRNNLLNEKKEYEDIEDDITIRKRDPAFLEDDLPFSNKVKINNETILKEKELLKLKDLKDSKSNLQKKNMSPREELNTQKIKKANITKKSKSTKYKFLHD